MKRLIIVCAALFLCSTAGFAQDAPHAAASAATAVATDQSAENNAKAVKAACDLSEKQYKKAVEIEAAFLTKQKETQAPGTRLPGGSRSLVLEKDAKYRQLLSDDQYTKYTAMHPAFVPAPMGQEAVMPPAQNVPASSRK